MQFRCFMCTQKGACPTIVKDILIRIYIYIFKKFHLTTKNGKICGFVLYITCLLRHKYDLRI